MSRGSENSLKLRQNLGGNIQITRKRQVSTKGINKLRTAMAIIFKPNKIVGIENSCLFAFHWHEYCNKNTLFSYTMDCRMSPIFWRENSKLMSSSGGTLSTQ